MARDSDSKKRQWWHEFDVQVSPKDPVYPAPVGEQQDRVPGSTPFDDSQIGPRNAYLFQSPLRLRSSAATPEAIIDASPSAMRCQLPSDLSSPSTPSRPAASNVSSRHHAATDRVLAVFPRGPSSPHPLPPSPSRQTHRSQTSASPSLPVNPASLWRNAEYPPPPPVLPSPSPADPALEQFRTARTFRTRTVLQLQPYTKERQIYEAALRRGGLKKGKKAIADSCEIAREEEDHEEEGRHEESSEAQETPERLMIGGTPPSTAQRKPRSPKPLVKADFDEYFLEYGEVAEEDDPDIFEKLQTIARNRVKEQKEQRKKARAARIAKKRFEELLNHSADDAAAPVTGEKVSQSVPL